MSSRILTAPVVASLLALSLGACAPPATPARAAGPPASQLRIGLVEWGFTSSSSALVAGPVELQVTNAGSTSHDLQLLVGDEVVAATQTLRPGESQTLRADLTGASGAATLLCTLPGHESQGMVERIEVVEAATATGRHSG